MSLPKKYLICLPQGGFNDMLNRIYFSYQYALRNKRILVIDTRRCDFRDDIRKYIIFNLIKGSYYTGSFDELYKNLQNKSIYPEEFTGKNINSIDIKSESLYFNPTKLYFQQVLITCGYGGGIEADSLLKSCRFTEKIINEYRRRKEILPSLYISIHIRNTDYTSDIPKFLEEINVNESDIFLASDNADTIEIFKEKYGSRLYSFSNIPKGSYGQNIHIDLKTSSNAENINIDCIVDLLLLASGSKILYSLNKSGYTKLALSIHKQPDLLSHLILNEWSKK